MRRLILEISLLHSVLLAWHGHLSFPSIRGPSLPGPSIVCSSQRSLGEVMAMQNDEGEDACNDTCCICLEDLTQGGASSVTSCNHQYHLQCILEWCQRSSNCPTCRQQVSLKEPESQYLLEKVEQEKKMKAEALRNAAARINPSQILSSRRATEAEIQEQLRLYIANMSQRYQFSASLESVSSTDESLVRENEIARFFEFQAFSNALISQFNSLQSRYRNSILGRTSGWKERILFRSNTMA